MRPSTKKYIVDLVNSGLTGDTNLFELAALSLARSVKKDSPNLFNDINKAISSFTINGGASIRGNGSPLPIDHESKLEMAMLKPPNLELNVCPILSDTIINKINIFLDERDKIDLLLEQNIKPSSSILLTGPPGTGKTMLAKHIASKLDKNLLILDLSSSISSLMGKTGANLKKVLQYAKQQPSVLLFDEFDAIAKKRNDSTDLGELKRVVNVLLMELEDWPVSSLFIATTNHPELLDKAIWRRFDHSIEIHLPKQQERISILNHELKEFIESSNTTSSILEPIAEYFTEKSPADLCKYANNVKRRSIIKEEKPLVSLFEELDGFKEDKKMRARFCVLAKEILKDSITVRELSEITGLSPSGVQHHLKNK